MEGQQLQRWMWLCDGYPEKEMFTEALGRNIPDRMLSTSRGQLDLGREREKDRGEGREEMRKVWILPLSGQWKVTEMFLSRSSTRASCFQWLWLPVEKWGQEQNLIDQLSQWEVIGGAAEGKGVNEQVLFEGQHALLMEYKGGEGRRIKDD